MNLPSLVEDYDAEVHHRSEDLLVYTFPGGKWEVEGAIKGIIIGLKRVQELN